MLLSRGLSWEVMYHRASEDAGKRWADRHPSHDGLGASVVSSLRSTVAVASCIWLWHEYAWAKQKNGVSATADSWHPPRAKALSLTHNWRCCREWTRSGNATENPGFHEYNHPWGAISSVSPAGVQPLQPLASSLDLLRTSSIRSQLEFERGWNARLERCGLMGKRQPWRARLSPRIFRNEVGWTSQRGTVTVGFWLRWFHRLAPGCMPVANRREPLAQRVQLLRLQYTMARRRSGCCSRLVVDENEYRLLDVGTRVDGRPNEDFYLRSLCNGYCSCWLSSIVRLTEQNVPSRFRRPNWYLPLLDRSDHLFRPLPSVPIAQMRPENQTVKAHRLAHASCESHLRNRSDYALLATFMTPARPADPVRHCSSQGQPSQNSDSVVLSATIVASPHRSLCRITLPPLVS